MGNVPIILSPCDARMVINLWGKNKQNQLKNMQKQHLLATGITCGLSASVCADLIDAMIGKTPDVIGFGSGPLPAEIPAHVGDAIFQRVCLRGKDACLKRME